MYSDSFILLWQYTYMLLFGGFGINMENQAKRVCASGCAGSAERRVVLKAKFCTFNFPKNLFMQQIDY